jgi:cyanate permease
MACMVLAHQGGWDEGLLVLAPLTVIAGLLWLANRRADAHARRLERDRTDSSPEQGRPQ